ncbi:hypothetical protein FOZ62_000534 [Perkinsus olseni]|uniref:Uncharacterized protein n=2 Tax=Perkinsus olseni TaxID=32597 RepID=A0A7J6RXN8_PEROL|nr:hypothetical protein FOZ62_000534 [Perkinsus olseni]
MLAFGEHLWRSGSKIQLLLLFVLVSTLVVEGGIRHPRCLAGPCNKARYYLFPHEVVRGQGSHPEPSGGGKPVNPSISYKLQDGIRHAYYDFLGFDDDDDHTINEGTVTKVTAIRAAKWPRGTQEYLVTLGNGTDQACFSAVSYVERWMASLGEISTKLVDMENDREKRKIMTELETMCREGVLTELAMPDSNPPATDGKWFGNSEDLRISLKYKDGSPNLGVTEVNYGDLTRRRVVAEPGEEGDVDAAAYRVLYVKIGDVFLAQIADLRRSRLNWMDLSLIRYTILEPVYDKANPVQRVRAAVGELARGGGRYSKAMKGYSRMKDASVSTDRTYGRREIKAWRSV